MNYFSFVSNTSFKLFIILTIFYENKILCLIAFVNVLLNTVVHMWLLLKEWNTLWILSRWYYFCKLWHCHHMQNSLLSKTSNSCSVINMLTSCIWTTVLLGFFTSSTGQNFTFPIPFYYLISILFPGSSLKKILDFDFYCVQY